ncbi:MAG: hypothetical protein LBE20_06840 [Deltaproteobacteria bacterium]|jgi:hypothetical protein|nr:hypothetical protein [Deltaproteobacteria bacterium]
MKKIILCMMAGWLCSCSSGTFEVLNPFGDDSDSGQVYGERSNKAILDNSGAKSSTAENARYALEVLGTYRAAQDPQPYYPVMQPAEVRLMWVPDHLNKAGDLVPAHYFYLKVLEDRWAVQDAFEMERQLGTGSDASATPWVYGNQK